MNYIEPALYGLGIFLGVLAGTTVNLLVQWLQEKRAEKQKVRNLLFELNLNIKKLNDWSNELGKYRNSVNGESLATYYGYFDLSRIITITVDTMFRTGLLYKYLSYEDIGKLQSFFSLYLNSFEPRINSQIKEYKDTVGQSDQWPLGLKAKIVQEIDVWEMRFESDKSALEDICSKLK
ncbi:MAG: hypothetical protein WBO46_10435 [Caldilineaceae bacterium]